MQINEAIIKKSKFITIIDKLDNAETANEILEKIKNLYPKATHYCYAFLVNTNAKYSDDGEPKGSAGIQIYNTLIQNKASNVMCIIVRYYGGVKLGSGNLIRTYRKLTNENIKKFYLENK